MKLTKVEMYSNIDGKVELYASTDDLEASHGVSPEEYAEMVSNQAFKGKLKLSENRLVEVMSNDEEDLYMFITYVDRRKNENN